MRELLENALYAPTRARFKVYIIDEVHMLSRSAFNAMLKTLEEPPEHVKFILATTDPQKVPVTVLSRCLQFNLKQIPVQQIRGQLGNVLEQEGIGFEPAALNLIARAAHGSMRDGLSLLDQAIAHGAGKVEDASVRAMLGAVDQEYLFSLSGRACARRRRGPDPDRRRDAGPQSVPSKPRCRIWRRCCIGWPWCRRVPGRAVAPTIPDSRAPAGAGAPVFPGGSTALLPDRAPGARGPRRWPPTSTQDSP